MKELIKFKPGYRNNELRLIERTGKGRGVWFCSCGNKKSIKISHVTGGLIKSCGCKTAEYVSIARTKPGVRINGKQSAEYTIWKGMRQRCNNPNSPAYNHYGGRGIKVDERWDSFPAFLEDMGRRPQKGYGLERINNNGDYEPGNVVWATMKEQANNRRSNHWVAFDGETKTIAQWSDVLGIDQNLLCWRVKFMKDGGLAVAHYLSSSPIKSSGM